MTLQARSSVEHTKAVLTCEGVEDLLKSRLLARVLTNRPSLLHRLHDSIQTSIGKRLLLLESQHQVRAVERDDLSLARALVELLDNRGHFILQLNVAHESVHVDRATGVDPFELGTENTARAEFSLNFDKELNVVLVLKLLSPSLEGTQDHFPLVRRSVHLERLELLLKIADTQVDLDLEAASVGGLNLLETAETLELSLGHDPDLIR